jgi:hypothetical protein
MIVAIVALFQSLVLADNLLELMKTCNKEEVCKLMNQSQPTMDNIPLESGKRFTRTNVFFSLHSHLDAFWL